MRRSTPEEPALSQHPLKHSRGRGLGTNARPGGCSVLIPAEDLDRRPDVPDAAKAAERQEERILLVVDAAMTRLGRGEQRDTRIVSPGEPVDPVWNGAVDREWRPMQHDPRRQLFDTGGPDSEESSGIRARVSARTRVPVKPRGVCTNTVPER